MIGKIIEITRIPENEILVIQGIRRIRCYIAIRESMRTLLISLVLILQGCMSTEVVPQGPVFNYTNQPVKDEVIAYFYQFDMPGVNACLLVGVNGKYEGCIGYPGFTKVTVSPGKNEVSFTPNAPIKIANLRMDFDFESGTEYFFKYQLTADKFATDIELKTQYNILLDQTFGWYLVEKQRALVELNGLKAWHRAI